MSLSAVMSLCFGSLQATDWSTKTTTFLKVLMMTEELLAKLVSWSHKMMVWTQTKVVSNIIAADTSDPRVWAWHWAGSSRVTSLLAWLTRIMADQYNSVLVVSACRSSGRPLPCPESLHQWEDRIILGVLASLCPGVRGQICGDMSDYGWVKTGPFLTITCVTMYQFVPSHACQLVCKISCCKRRFKIREEWSPSWRLNCFIIASDGRYRSLYAHYDYVTLKLHLSCLW